MFKKIVICLIYHFAMQTANAQSLSCCVSENQFQNFASDLAFVNVHQEVIPFHYIDQLGKIIQFETSGGIEASAYAISCPSDKYLIVLHEWWGLNDYIKLMADKLFKDLGQSVNIIALDMYDGNIATTKEEAASYMQSLSVERTQQILLGIKNKLGDKVQIASIGWCMGGGLSLQTAMIFGPQSVACVMYYGMPELDTNKLKENLFAPVLFFHATQDKWINDDVVAQFEKQMQSINKQLEVVRYDAVHGFANPSNPKHVDSYTKEAYLKAIAFFQSVFI